jgi:hypothetical protein
VLIYCAIVLAPAPRQHQDAGSWQTRPVAMVDDAAREALLRRGYTLEYATLGWNVVGIVVLAIAAISPRSVALAGFGLDSLIEGREECPVRPVQFRAARLPPLQDGELVAQDQDLCGLACLLTPGQPQPRC